MFSLITGQKPQNPAEIVNPLGAVKDNVADKVESAAGDGFEEMS